MAKIPIEIWSQDRSIKKTFLCTPTLSEVIKKANNAGIPGLKIVLEKTGAELIDDEILEYYSSEKGTVLMLLEENSYWTRETLDFSFSEGSYDVANSSIHQSDEHNYNAVLSSGLIEFTPSSSNSELRVASPSRSIASTLSMSSGALSSSSSTNSEALKLFSTFEIPWNKLPADIKLMLRKKETLGGRLRAFINYVVDELRNYSYFIPVRIFRTVAEQIRNKYPDSFMQKDRQNRVITSYSQSLIMMMRNRNNFLNRTAHCHSAVSNMHIKNRKRSNSLREFAKNWEPNQDHNSNSSLLDKQKILQNIYVDNRISDNKEVILKYMSDCFPIQRTFFNGAGNYPSILSIKENWPFIFQKDCLYQHFLQLTEIDKKILESDFQEERQRLLQYFRKSQNKMIKQIINEENEKTIIKVVASYFKENSDFLFKEFAVGITLSELESQIPTSGPWIAMVDTSPEDTVFYIYTEKVQVLSFENKSLNLCLILCICIFYAFNMEYPKEISQTIDFFVKYFLKLYTEGARGPKKSLYNVTKITNLIAKINNV